MLFGISIISGKAFYHQKSGRTTFLLTFIVISIDNLMLISTFLSNPDEAEKLNTDSYQDQIAYAIYEGILYYFDNPDMEVD